VPENVAVKVLNRAHSLTAEVEVPSGAQGVLICHGSNAGGYALFVQDGKLHYVHNYVGAEEFHLASSSPVPSGRVSLRYEFEPTGKPEIARGKGTPGRGKLFIDDRPVGELDLPYTIPLLIGLGGGLAVGRNPASSVSQLYAPPFAFTGTIFKVTADVSGQMLQDTGEEAKAAARQAMSRQ
jgi:arylsulfatase